MKYVVVLALIAIVFVGATFQIAPNGDAYVDDANVEIRAPFTVGGVNNYLTGYIRPKAYTGDINIVFGFDSDIARPTNGYFSRPETITRSRVCEGIGSVNVDTKTATCSGIDENGTQYVLWSQRYDTLSGATNTIYWDETITATYRANQFVKRADITYNDKDRWYYASNIPISPDQPVTYSIEFDSLLGSVVKYDVGFYPSSYGTTRAGVLQAIQNNQFYLLDPFINNTYYRVGNVSNNTNTWVYDANTTATTIAYSSDNKTFTAGYVAPDTVDAIKMYWQDFGEGSGTAINDSINNYDGTITPSSGSWQTTGFPTNLLGAYKFSGTTIVNMGSQNIFNNWGGGKTISYWYEPNKASTFYRLFDRQGTTQGGWFIYHRGDLGGRVQLSQDWTANDGQWRSNTDITEGVYNHVMVSYNSDSTANDPLICINGVSSSITEIDAPAGTLLSNAGKTFYYGARAGTSEFYQGNLSQVIAFNQSFGNCDVAAEIYNSGVGINFSGYSGFDSTKNTFRSLPLPMSINASSVTITFTGVGVTTSNVTVNASCDGSTFSVITNNSVFDCVDGDVFEYILTIDTVYPSLSPIVYNLTAVFTAASSVTAPNITAITFSPVSPTVSDNVIASTVYTDAEGDLGTVFAYWYINNVSVLNQTQGNITNGSTVQFTLSSTYTAVNDTVLVYMNATDGSLYTNTLNDSVTISAVPTPTPTETNTAMNITIILVIVLILLSFYLGAANGNIAFIAVSFILTAAFLYLFSTGEFAAYESWEAIYLSFGVIMLFLQMWASGRLYK